MLIKNKAQLERKHPDFDNEIGIVSSVVEGVKSIVNTDFFSFFSENYPNYRIDVKNFFLSSQAKEMHVYGENNNCVFYQLFQRDGFSFTYDVDDSELLNIACKADVADSLHIFVSVGFTLIYNVDFKKDNTYRGSCVVSAQNSQPVLEKYSLERI